jgi:hypothetical protein
MKKLKGLKEGLRGPCGSIPQGGHLYAGLMMHLSRVGIPRYQRIVNQNIKANHNINGVKWSKPLDWKS